MVPVHPYSLRFSAGPPPTANTGWLRARREPAVNCLYLALRGVNPLAGLSATRLPRAGPADG
ncbi:hypothetical protein GCM10010124_01900 [Pilimelia terevasa]|uniref:Uncharacterized protein n=1 Tax=Pilimelia terevasa TaxID=53372 RepID=A0A8J3BLU0_9ACTN|nr:hypothetical protein GCM10010124_01900 [Pilimelia terevasa]